MSSASPDWERGLRFQTDGVPDLDIPALQNDGQYAAPAEYLLLQARYERIHFLARLAVTGHLQGDVVVRVADEKDVTLTSLRKVHARYRDVFLYLPRFQPVMVERFFIHDQDLPEISRVAAAIALQAFSRNCPGLYHRVGRGAFHSGDVQVHYVAGLHGMLLGIRPDPASHLRMADRRDLGYGRAFGKRGFAAGPNHWVECNPIRSPRRFPGRCEAFDMAYEFIKTEVVDGVLVMTMHDPPTRNALGPDMAAEMFERLDEFENNPEERVLLLTGTEPSFCSGANVRGFRQRIEEREGEAEPEPLTWGKMEYMKGRRQSSERGPRVNFVPLRIHDLQKPSIAVVNGPAAGVGCGLALSCDIRVVGDSGRLSERFRAQRPDTRRRQLLAVAQADRRQQHLVAPVHRGLDGRRGRRSNRAGQQVLPG